MTRGESHFVVSDGEHTFSVEQGTVTDVSLHRPQLDVHTETPPAPGEVHHVDVDPVVGGVVLSALIVAAAGMTWYASWRRH